LGQNMGLKKGTLFSISSPSTKRTIGEREIIIPGHQVGIVEVTELSQDANRGRILRKWAVIEPGFPAVESTSGILAGGLGIKYGTGSTDMGLEFAGYINPLRRFGGSVFFGLGTLKDSRDDTDFNLRFGGDIYFRLINTIPFSLAASLSLPFNIVFRPDDGEKMGENEHTVNSIMFSPVVGGRFEIMLNSKTDLVATVGYCLTSQMSKWDYSEEDNDGESQSQQAIWENSDAPDIDPTGLYFNIGLRFLIFNAGIGMPSFSDLRNFR